MAKTISASVGQGGSNTRNDVATVQYLLNCVHVDQGGPVKELAVDGLVGPLTVNAIVCFQKLRFKSADGRVDVGGKTFTELLRYDPCPDSGPVVPVTPGGGKSGGKGSQGKGSGKGGGKSPGKSGGKGLPPSTQETIDNLLATTWKAHQAALDQVYGGKLPGKFWTPGGKS